MGKAIKRTTSLYVPPAFREERIEVMHDAIRNAGLATLVTHDEDGLAASHVPVLLDPDAGPYGTIYGHLARANPQARPLGPPPDALLIFLGPDAYVSPSWYETKRETGKVVPTWNYVAIHAQGRLDLFDDSDRLRQVVDRLTTKHEADRPDPWAVSDAPTGFIEAQLGGIIGFELRIARIEGKWKMSQNRPASDRDGVAAGLAAHGGRAGEVATLVGGR